jgi:hypothetical protein
MKRVLVYTAVLTLIFTSCKKNEEETKPKAIIPFTQISNTQGNQAITSSQPNGDKGILYQQNAGNQSSTTQVPTTVAPASTAKGMNPQHGQPGHRCDIPVGAPLNSASTNAKTTTAAVTSKPTVTMTPTTTTTVTTPKGMNPPHGQAGHRCDIPVGSPLNTPAPTTTTTPEVITTPKLLSTDTKEETPSNQ